MAVAVSADQTVAFWRPTAPAWMPLNWVLPAAGVRCLGFAAAGLVGHLRLAELIGYWAFENSHKSFPDQPASSTP